MKHFLVRLSLDGYPAAIVSAAAVVLGLTVLVLVWLRGARPVWSVGLRRVAGIAAGVAAAALLTALLRYLVESVWRPFPDALPLAVWAWIGTGLAGVVLGVGALVHALRRRTPPRRAARRGLAAGLAVLATVVVVVGAAQQINMKFSAYPNAGTLLGIEPFARMSAEEALRPAAGTVAAGSRQTIADVVPRDWRAADGSRPTQGAVFQADIPGTASGFSARPAQIYVPPAYFAEPRPQLPVIVAMAGEPGGPEDWITSVEAPSILDDFAQRNGGLAPILVVADPIAQRLGNTLCIDSAHGNADTYLSVDVPRWTRDNLQAAADPQQWAVAGLSFGGTCALQMSLYHPDLYPTFLAMSAQDEPSLGNHAQTVQFFFGGDEAAFAAKNPLDLMAHRKFPELAGAFVVGAQDNEFRPWAEKLHAAAVQAGIDAELSELGGGHSYALWRNGFAKYLPWISARTRLVAQPA